MHSGLNIHLEYNSLLVTNWASLALQISCCLHPSQIILSHLAKRCCDCIVQLNTVIKNISCVVGKVTALSLCVYLRALQNGTCNLWATRFCCWHCFSGLWGRRWDAIGGNPYFCLGGSAQNTKTLQKLSVLQLLLLVHRHLTPHTLKLRSKRKHNNHPHRVGATNNTPKRVTHST